jgi:hypothetical protein
MKKIMIISALFVSLILQTTVSLAANRYPGHQHSKHHKGHKVKSHKGKDPAYQN